MVVGWLSSERPDGARLQRGDRIWTASRKFANEMCKRPSYIEASHGLEEFYVDLLMLGGYLLS